MWKLEIVPTKDREPLSFGLRMFAKEMDTCVGEEWYIIVKGPSRIRRRPIRTLERDGGNNKNLIVTNYKPRGRSVTELNTREGVM